MRESSEVDDEEVGKEMDVVRFRAKELDTAGERGE